MGQELRELRAEIAAMNAAINREIAATNSAINRMIPKLDYCIEELKGINTEQGFMRTLFGRHEAKIEGAEKDIDGLGIKIEKILEEERARAAEFRINQFAEKAKREAEGGPNWTMFVAAVTFFKSHWKDITLLIGGITAALGALWEFLRKR